MDAVLPAGIGCVGYGSHVVDRGQVVPNLYGRKGRIEVALSVSRVGTTACSRPEFLFSAKEVEDYDRGDDERCKNAEDSAYDSSHVRMGYSCVGWACAG